jgi:DNA-binding NarL/FixJ family response regulator
MKVLVIDDHPIVAKGCARLLEGTVATTFISAADVDEGYVAYSRERPGIIIVDLAMGRDIGRGLEFIKRLRDQKSSTPIIVLSAHTDRNLISQAVQLGASAYVLKDASAGELRAAFHSVLAGKRYMSEDLAEKIAFGGTARGPSATELSTTEHAILTQMAEGKTYGAIAASMETSKTTIVHAVAALKLKLGAPTLNELLHFALTVDRQGPESRPQKSSGGSALN